MHRGHLAHPLHSSRRAVTAAAASHIEFPPNPDAPKGVPSAALPHAPALPVRPTRPQRPAHSQPMEPDTPRQHDHASAVAADTTGVARDRAVTAASPEVPRGEREPSGREQHHRQPRAGGEDNLRLAVLRASNTAAWLAIVRQYATAVEASASSPGWKGMRHGEAHFAADALFRAAQLLRDEGRSGGQIQASSSGGPALLDTGSGVQGPAFRAALEMLLGHVAQCTSAQLYDSDAFRCCRTLWALGKLAGGVGSDVGADPAGAQQEQEREGKEQPHQHLSHALMTDQGRLVASALAWKVADLAQAAQQPPQRSGHAASPNAAAEAAAAGAGAGGDGPGRGPAKEYDTLCAPWLLAMAMWGLARLRNQGYACTDRPDPACLAPAASPADATPRAAVAGPPAPLAARPPRGPEAALWEALTGIVVRPAVLSALSCRELSNVLWALATARHSPNLIAMGALLDAMTARLLAAAGAPKPRGSFSGAHVAAGAGGADVNGQDVSNAVWALARLRVEAEELQRLLRAAEGCVLRLLPELRPMHVASLLWSFTTLRWVNPVGEARAKGAWAMGPSRAPGRGEVAWTRSALGWSERRWVRKGGPIAWRPVSSAWSC